MKINIVALILIIIITLLLGGIAGYVVNSSISNNEMEDKLQDNIEEIKEENKEKIEDSSNVVEILEYDGSKSIVIDGKTYTVSYISEKFEYIENNELEQTEVKLYLNDKKIKTLNLGYFIDVNHEFGIKDYEVELYSFCKEYILIVIKNKHNDGEHDDVNRVKFCIINTRGEHIDTLEWDDATSIVSVETGEKLTYEISEESIILYEIYENGALKTKYTVIRDFMKEELLEVYDENQVTGAGK